MRRALRRRADSHARSAAVTVLPRAFYARDTLAVAQELLGTTLVHLVDGRRRAGLIVETEAYVGPDDGASHAARGRTRRTAVMFGPPGVAYVYLIYGMHNCLNAVTEPEGYPAAVLIRALEPTEGVVGRTDGPGRLCKALAIDRRLDGAPLTGPPLWIEPRRPDRPPVEIARGPRVGVAYAGEWAARPWRFWIAGNCYVSRPSGAAATPRALRAAAQPARPGASRVGSGESDATPAPPRREP